MAKWIVVLFTHTLTPIHLLLSIYTLTKATMYVKKCLYCTGIGRIKSFHGEKPKQNSFQPTGCFLFFRLM